MASESPEVALASNVTKEAGAAPRVIFSACFVQDKRVPAEL